jgi:hypothetical protein
MNLKRELLPVVLIVFAVILTSRAAVMTPESEHTIWVKLDTTPTGAELYVPPTGNEPPGVRIGTTPCIVALDLSWKVSWFKKQWERISVRSPGNICHYVFQPDRSYELFLNFMAVKPGFKNGRADLRVVILKDPGPDWNGKYQWPTKRFLNVNLIPADKSSSLDDPKVPLAKTVLFAGGEAKGKPGMLNVSANVKSAKVIVDDQVVGTTPLQVVLPEGRHTVIIQKAGFQPLQKEIHVTRDAMVTLKAALSP